MFCYQCEETAKGEGCTAVGVCGKDEVTAAHQDALIYILKGLSIRNLSAKKAGKGNKEVDSFIVNALFATLTNVNFDNSRLGEFIKTAVELRGSLPKIEDEPDECIWTPSSEKDIIGKTKESGWLAITNEDVRSLRALLIFGLKGIGAYYSHAMVLGYEDDLITSFLQEALASTTRDLSVDEMVAMVLKCGEIGVRTLATLDTENTKTYGNPRITTVSTKPGDRPGILITGHDLKDLKMLLKQSEDAGVDIYTHGEMLPAHGYPEFKKYSHLKGNYGGSWPHQKQEFEAFNGPILVTTNCLVPPKDSYKSRVFTTGVVGFQGLTHISEKADGTKDFGALIELAKRSSPPGVLPVESSNGRELITGCAHAAVLSIADTVIESIKSGAIKRFVVMAGCDGRQREREYYTKFAKALPQDVVILTAGCAKYRYNSLDLGTIGGIPRVIDAGQCNDCYSLILIAQALAEAFGVGINELPVSYNIAWYEQKAVLVLLALLHLGVKNITLGPKLPAFISPAVLKVLVDTFGIKPNTTVEADLSRMVEV